MRQRRREDQVTEAKRLFPLLPRGSCQDSLHPQWARRPRNHTPSLCFPGAGTTQVTARMGCTLRGLEGPGTTCSPSDSPGRALPK